MSQSQRGSSVDKLLYIEVNNLNHVESKFLGPARFLGPPITYIIKIQSLWLYTRGGVLRALSFSQTSCMYLDHVVTFCQTRRFGFIWEFSMVTQQHPSHNAHIYIWYIYIRISQSDLVPRAISDFDLGTKMKAYNTLQTIHPKTDEPDASRCPMKPVNALSRPCRKTGHQTHRFTRLFGAIYCQSFHHQY